MQYFNFQNVSISIEAKTGQEAYLKLCNALDTIKGCEWSTDTYTIDDREESRPTSELFPDIGKITPTEIREKILLAAFAELIAESATVKTHHNSEFDKARRKALRLYQREIAKK